VVNAKSTYRVYREEGLMLRKSRRKNLLVTEQHLLECPMQSDEVRSLDFVVDQFANGRRVKTLTDVDDCSKEVA
jgi:putative transposase